MSKAEKAYHRDDSFGEASRMSLELIPFDFGLGWTRGKVGPVQSYPDFHLVFAIKIGFPMGSLSFGGAAFLFLVKYRT